MKRRWMIVLCIIGVVVLTGIGAMAENDIETVIDVERSEVIEIAEESMGEVGPTLESIDIQDIEVPNLTEGDLTAPDDGLSVKFLDLEDEQTDRASSTENGFTEVNYDLDAFEIDENGVLVKYHGSGGDVVIPEGVTSIGEEAFDNCNSLTGIIIPKGVTSIGDRAFRLCTRLNGVTLPDGVTSIGCDAFGGCSSLTSISIPESVTIIYAAALSFVQV